MSTALDPLKDFRLTVRIIGDEAVVGVRGEVDLLTAPELAAVLTAVIDLGNPSVVLDLAGTTFMGAAGLRIIEAATVRLAPSRGLALRSPSAQVRRLLDITGLAETVRVDHLDDVDVVQAEEDADAEGVDGLGREQTAAVPGTPVKVGPTKLAGQLRHVTAIPADNDVVDGALRLVVALARATVEAADGVSVSLHRHGRLTTVASSDQTILDMDADQYATGEGPCVDAAVEGRWFHVKSLDRETRWPAFTAKARKLGIGAILSTPLLAEDRPVGALNIYSHTPEAFAAKDQDLASIFATEASAILRDAGVDVSDDQLAGRVTDALQTRQTIAQAQGVLMERRGISEHQAYTQLRRFSQETSQPLDQRAADIVGSTKRERRCLPAQPEEAT